MKASDLFVKALENEDVEYIFAVPGEENLDLLESLRLSKQIKLILTRHEQGAAFMAAMLYPDRRVMAICGDGGFMMNSQELETAIRLGLNMVVTILNDNSYGMIRWKQAEAGFADWGLEFGNPDFVRYAQRYSAIGHRILHTEDIVPTYEAAFTSRGVHIIEVPMDYSENKRVLIDELREKVCLI